MQKQKFHKKERHILEFPELHLLKTIQKNKKAYAQFDNAGKNFYAKNIRCATAQSISYNKYIAKRGMRYKYKATIISVKKIKGKKYKVKVKTTYVPQKTNNANYSKYSGVYNISLK